MTAEQYGFRIQYLGHTPKRKLSSANVLLLLPVGILSPGAVFIIQARKLCAAKSCRVYFHAKSLYTSIGLVDGSESSEISLESRTALYRTDFELFRVFAVKHNWIFYTSWFEITLTLSLI